MQSSSFDRKFRNDVFVCHSSYFIFLNVTKSAGVYGRVSCAYAIRCGYPHNTREACFAFGCRNSYN